MTQQKIGRYEIKSELGRGGMATVYKAYDPRFEREVAIKVLPRELLHDPQFRVRFEREAKTIAALEHQSIVPVYDVGDEDGQPYFVMRCMTGGSLADIIAKGPMTLSATIRIIERLAPAMDEAHFKGIVHRDLKPGNILFDRAGEPFVSDFGIAKMTQSQGATVTGGAIIGTPAYMSPEQAQGEPVDGRSDVYALGVIIFEMLSGTQPFQATTPMAVVVKQITEPVPHILDKTPNLPPGIEAVIEKAMAKSPAARFATAGELSLALSAVAGGQNAEEAFKTASITASRLANARTKILPGKTSIAKPAAPAGGFHIALPLILVGGLLGLCLLLVVALGIFRVCPPGGPMPLIPWCGAEANIPPVTIPTQPVAIQLTDTPAPTLTTEPTLPATPTLPAATDAPTAAPSATALPVAVVAPGGVDEIAFIASNEVWLMNVDGSKLRVLTNDKAPKSNLQWVPGANQLVFISGTNVNSIDVDTGKFDTILSFPFAKFLDEFRISPDGKQVAISLNREMYVVPFDMAKLATVRGRDGLIAMKGCLSYMGNTQTAIHLKEFRWGKDGKTAAWLFEGGDSAGQAVDLIRILDISSCNPQKLFPKDEFPGTRFTPLGYERNSVLPNFDWDGGYLFLMNTLDHNSWGFLYTYSSDLHKGYQENPIAASKSQCCYSDARWSPDGSYVFFAFQNKDAPNSPEQFYYIPVNQIRAGVDLTPIPLPADFFKDPKEAPQPALHIAK